VDSIGKHWYVHTIDGNRSKWKTTSSDVRQTHGSAVRTELPQGSLIRCCLCRVNLQIAFSVLVSRGKQRVRRENLDRF
jgi:hypothetical protein